MKIFYTAYAKPINGIPFYFVKSFKTFPEYGSVAPILETYGMHTNFEQACQIAMIFDKEIQQKLLVEMESNIASYNVLPLYPSVAEVYNLRRRQISFPSILKLFRLG